ncbi:MAG TPA: alpha/beta hydrolase [Rhizobiales bacterium]|nr:alpha/beta hydrolase [Hyphomicrobiales bacterium]
MIRSRLIIPLLLGLYGVLVLTPLAGARGQERKDEPYRLAPYKDGLFGYPRILRSAYGGDFLRVEYIKARDLYQRDTVPMKRVRRRYLSLATRESERDYTLREGRITVRFIGTGKISGGAKSIVIFVHGQNGTRFLGSNDQMFGGNFNRIKNLMLRNDGAYLSPRVSDFRARGTAEIALVMKTMAERSPGAPIFLACGSMGGAICWRIVQNRRMARLLGGLLLLGSTYDVGFLKNAAAIGRRVPIYLGHGGDDKVFDWRGQARFFKRLRKIAPGYPVRMVLFDTGSHGTPIRMTDWREIINWMLVVNEL